MPSKSPLASLFNCEDLSDGILEIIEENHKLKIDTDTPNKKLKLEKEQTTILSIHSLLFSSNSEYFRKLISSTSPNYRIKVFIQPNSTELFLNLIKLFYDSTCIDNMTLTNCVGALRLAAQYSCSAICEQLLRHISSSTLETIDIVNEAIRVFYDFVNETNEAVTNAVNKIKLTCVKYLKSKFCPCEKISGYLLEQFLQLPYTSLLFFLEYIEKAISVTENTVIGLVLYWSACNYSDIKDDDSKIFALVNACRFTQISDVSFLLDVVPPNHPVLSGLEWYSKFYITILECFLSVNPMFYYPEFPQKDKRQINFACDHDVILYFQICKERKNFVKEESELMLHVELETCEKNTFFVKGYQINLSAVIREKDNKVLQIKLKVENLARTYHSNLFFSMSYSIASPSLSDKFSPWSYCEFNVASDSSCSYATISRVAQHSLIVDTGFYLRCYLE